MARILIIDDENNIRLMLRLALQAAGHDADTAGDGLEGLEKFGPTGAGWDLVLLDQRMPGLEVLREMRGRAPHSRIILITAFGTIDLAADALRAGATDFLRKPFTVETLRGSVGAALEGGRARASASGAPSDTAAKFAVDLDQANINGFRLASSPGVTWHKDGSVEDAFSVTNAAGETHACRVTLPAYLVELVKLHADRETLPGGASFWQALCGEALANHLWQHAEFPPGDALRVEDLTSGLRHWLDAVLLTSEN